MMAKITIDKNTLPGMGLAFCILAVIGGVIALFTQEDPFYGLVMIVTGGSIVAAWIIGQKNKAKMMRRQVPPFGTGVIGQVNTFRTYTDSIPITQQQLRELYFSICRALPDNSVLPKLKRKYGEDRFYSRVAGEPNFARAVFAENPSRDLLQYIFSVNIDAACDICLEIAKNAAPGR